MANSDCIWVEFNAIGDYEGVVKIIKHVCRTILKFHLFWEHKQKS